MMAPIPMSAPCRAGWARPVAAGTIGGGGKTGGDTTGGTAGQLAIFSVVDFEAEWPSRVCADVQDDDAVTVPLA